MAQQWRSPPFLLFFLLALLSLLTAKTSSLHLTCPLDVPSSVNRLINTISSLKVHTFSPTTSSTPSRSFTIISDLGSSCLTPVEGLSAKLSHLLDATVNVPELHHCNSSSLFSAADVTRQLSSYFASGDASATTIVSIGFGFTLLPAVTNQIINFNGLSPVLFDYALDRDEREQYLYSYLRQPMELRYYADRQVDEAKAKDEIGAERRGAEASVFQLHCCF